MADKKEKHHPFPQALGGSNWGTVELDKEKHNEISARFNPAIKAARKLRNGED